jgi:hypothetical protein
LVRVSCQKCLSNPRTDWHKPPSLGRFALVDEISFVASVPVFPSHSEHFLLVSHPRIVLASSQEASRSLVQDGGCSPK